MKFLGKTSILLILVSFVAVSCGKYEDGPEISLLPKVTRLTNTWKLDEYLKDNVQQTVTAEEKDDYIEIEKDGTLSVNIVTSGTTTTFAGTWEFTADNANLRITYSGSVFGIPFTSDEEYTILRLKSDELWLEQLNGSTTEEWHYITK